MPYDPTTPAGKVRLLLNDVGPTDFVFTDGEIQAFLALEDQSVKRAAAQAIDTNADDQGLAAKVLTTRDLETNGANLARMLHDRADQLRDQAATEEQEANGGYFAVIEQDAYPHEPELVEDRYATPGP